MRKPKVVLTSRVHPEVITLLGEHCEVVPNTALARLPHEEIVARARDADALMAFMTDRIDEAFLTACPRLQVVGCALKGYDNFDVDACTRRGVWLTIVPDLLTVPTAELAIGLMLGLARHVLAGDRLVRAGGFDGWRPVLYGTGLAGSTVGIIGMGAVGRAIAARLQGWGARVLYSDPRPIAPEEESRLGMTRATLDALLAASDFVVPMVPYGPATEHLIDARALASMKPGAYLVNACRGSVVDERAVADALARGRLAGYAADVFELEEWARQGRPVAIPAALLADGTRTLFTPHLGSAVASVRLAIEMAAAHSILQALRGQMPDRAVNRPLACDAPAR